MIVDVVNNCFQSAEEEAGMVDGGDAEDYDASASLFSSDSNRQVIINLWIKLYMVIDGCWLSIMIYFQSAEEESDDVAAVDYNASASLFSFEDSTGQVIINLWIKLYMVIDWCWLCIMIEIVWWLMCIMIDFQSAEPGPSNGEAAEDGARNPQPISVEVILNFCFLITHIVWWLTCIMIDFQSAEPGLSNGEAAQILSPPNQDFSVITFISVNWIVVYQFLFLYAFDWQVWF